MQYEDEEYLSEMAYRAAAEAERSRFRSRTRALITFGLFAFVPGLALVIWSATIGYQHHVLEIETGGRIFRIVSHKSPFEIYTLDEAAKRPVEGGTFAVIDDDFKSDRVVPRAYDWATYASTYQRVHLPDQVSDYRFYVNDCEFSLTRSELNFADMRWQAAPGDVRIIEVDRLSPPPPEPIMAAPVTR